MILWRLGRILVTIFLPWLALVKARRQLYIACACMRNESVCAPTSSGERSLRWANECAHDGWIIWKPYYNEDTMTWRPNTTGTFHRVVRVLKCAVRLPLLVLAGALELLMLLIAFLALMISIALGWAAGFFLGFSSFLGWLGEFLPDMDWYLAKPDSVAPSDD